MVTVDLKRIHRVLSKGNVYYYAWRGGPRLKGEPGSDEFIASLAAARESRMIPDKSRFSAVITLYKASPDYQKLAASTKKNWTIWLDRIAEHFGKLSVAQFDRPASIRPMIRKWRARYAATPRSADYGMQVLSRVCSYAVDPLARISSNPCEGIKQLYKTDRAAIIWEDAEIASVLAECSEEAAWAVELAAHTGLRAGDLFRLSWSHVGEKAIVIATGKSRHKREAVIPLYQDLRTLLERIPRRSPVILTNSRKRPWTVNGYASVFAEAKRDASLTDRDLHFHDLRGTAATKFYKAGLSMRVIAEIMGWSEDEVDRIIRRYVSRSAAIEELIRKLDKPNCY